jgi:hypothetical protein
MAIATVEQVIHQSCLTTANIDNRRFPIRGRILDQPQGRFQMGCVPTNLGRLLGTVDLFPMLSRVHSLILAPTIGAQPNGRSSK